MIQRIQSIFLFVSAVAMIMMLFFPIWQKLDFQASEIATLDAFYLKYERFEKDSGNRELMSEKTTFYISIGAVLSALISLFAIFQYKNRLRQIQLGALNSLIMAATLFTGLYFTMKAEQLLSTQVQGNYLVGFYLPIAALICNLLANRFIRRDEKLVRSADRIR
jgi:hypothetical protein